MDLNPFNFASSLPLFALIILILSYFIWSKSRNRNSLKIKNLDHILEILVISLFLFFSISGFTLLFLMFLSILNLSFNISWILSLSPAMISMVAGGALFLFVVFFTRVNIKGKSLGNFFKKTIESYLAFFMFTITYSSLIFIFAPAMGKVISGNLLIEFIYSIVILFGLLCVTNESFSKIIKYHPKKILTKTLIWVLLISFGVSLLIFLFNTPFAHPHEIHPIQYMVYDSGRQTQQDFIYGRMNVSLKAGIFSSFPSFFAIDYKKYDLILNPRLYYANTPLMLSFMKNNTLILYTGVLSSGNEYGINNISADNNSLIIKFDRSSFIRSGIDHLTLSGLVSTNVSKDNFNSNLQVVHPKQGKYDIYFDFNSSFNLPLEMSREVLLNLKNDMSNTSSCRFTNMSLRYKLPSTPEESFVKLCDKDNCDVILKGVNSNFDPLEIKFSNEGGDTITRSRIYLDKNVSIQASMVIHISC